MQNETTMKNISQKLDVLIHSVDDRFETLIHSMNKRFDRIDQRFDGVDQRFDGMDKRMDKFDQRMDGSDKRMDGFDDQFKSVLATIDDLARMTKEGFDQVTGDIGFLKHEVASNGDAIVRLSNKVDVEMAAVHLHFARLDEHVGLLA